MEKLTALATLYFGERWIKWELHEHSLTLFVRTPQKSAWYFTVNEDGVYQGGCGSGIVNKTNLMVLHADPEGVAKFSEMLKTHLIDNDGSTA